ncbi:NUDIX domain-containing protein [Clostridium sp.]|uniref:bis(5'-nucleosyl)-tetraphosphatase n=1 Tax=Clostridium sp. TaxID=1506 RepID=UPI002FC7E2F8
MQNEKSCGAVVFLKKEQQVEFLIIQQNVNIYWGYPKGHMIDGEIEEETALREVKEETDLQIKLQPGFRHRIEYKPRPDVVKEVIFFLGEAEDKNVNIDKSEIQSYQWVTFEQGKEKVTHDVSKELLKEAYNYIMNKKN